MGAALAAIAATVACGSEFTTTNGSGSGGGGGGTTTGTTSSATATSSSGTGGESSSSSTGAGGMPPCPATAPQDGSSCPAEGQICDYDPCCPTTAECVGGTWSVQQASCPPITCPLEPPQGGSSCSCMAGLSCEYDLCTTALGSIAYAQCNGSIWTADATLCPDQGCGPSNPCALGEICVKKATGAGYDYFCAPNPCGDSPLTCACAGEVCGDPYVCGGINLTEVSCECPVCN